eukprot:scaffold54967_cov45-Attheya_sp.AAC.4
METRRLSAGRVTPGSCQTMYLWVNWNRLGTTGPNTRADTRTSAVAVRSIKLFGEMSLDFDAIKMATQVTLDGLIGSLRLEMTEGVVFPGVEEWEIEVALAVAVAQRAGDPVTGTEACRMALRFSLDLENRQRARQEGSFTCSQNSSGRIVPFGDSSGSTLWRAFTRSFEHFGDGILEVCKVSPLLDPMTQYLKGQDSWGLLGRYFGLLQV